MCLECRLDTCNIEGCLIRLLLLSVFNVSKSTLLSLILYSEHLVKTGIILSDSYQLLLNTPRLPTAACNPSESMILALSSTLSSQPSPTPSSTFISWATRQETPYKYALYTPSSFLLLNTLATNQIAIWESTPCISPPIQTAAVRLLVAIKAARYILADHFACFLFAFYYHGYHLGASVVMLSPLLFT